MSTKQFIICVLVIVLVFLSPVIMVAVATKTPAPELAPTPISLPVAVPPSPTPAPALPIGVRIYDKAKNSVVEISSNGFYGTGFLYGTRSQVATALHVVENVPAGSWEVEVSAGGKKIRARVSRLDEEWDLALLELENPVDEKPLSLESRLLIAGDSVWAIGNYFGRLPKSLSTGIVTGFPLGLIQFDAMVKPGSSGGPILNSDGKVVGVVTNELGRTGLAIPAEHLRILGDRPER